MMKNLYFTFVCVAIIVASTLAASIEKENADIESTINFLRSADVSNLKEELQPIAKLLQTRQEHSYCCAINHQNVSTEVRTRLVSVDVEVTTNIVVGYLPCEGSGGQSPQFTLPSIQSLLSGFQQFGTFATPSTPTTPVGCLINPIYEPVTYTKKEYKIETYLVTLVVSDCPVQHQICCEGYTMLLGQCIATHAIAGLQDLINLGLIG